MGDVGPDIEQVWGRVVATIAAGRDASGDARGDGADSSQDERVPVTIVTGFLGAGKTTMLRALLDDPADLVVSVLVNDLSSLPVDEWAVRGSTADVVTLSNGCTCCTLGPDLADALRRRVRGEGRPDVVVVELSGVSDAVAASQVVEGVEEVRLDGIVAVVDAVAGAEQLADPLLGPMLRSQLDAAHLVLLSKVDRCHPEAVDELTSRLAQQVPGRPVIPAARGDVDPRVLLGAARRGARPRPESAGHRLTLVDGVVQLGGPVSAPTLEERLDALPPGALRVKGWCATLDRGVVEVHAVGRRWSTTPVTRSVPVVGAMTVIATDEASLDAARTCLDGSHSRFHDVSRNGTKP